MGNGSPATNPPRTAGSTKKKTESTAVGIENTTKRKREKKENTAIMNMKDQVAIEVNPGDPEVIGRKNTVVEGSEAIESTGKSIAEKIGIMKGIAKKTIEVETFQGAHLKIVLGLLILSAQQATQVVILAVRLL